MFINTFLATAAAVCAWTFAEWIFRGTPTMLGAASGAVAGLVAITPACGWVGPMGALVIGLLAGVVCLFAVTKLKSALGYDDSLDVFGVHCVGGILGALLTGVFNNPALGGTGIYDYVAGTWGYAGTGTQVLSQLWGVGVTVVWSRRGVVRRLQAVDVVIGLRVVGRESRPKVSTRPSTASAATASERTVAGRSGTGLEKRALQAPVFFAAPRHGRRLAARLSTARSVTQCSFRHRSQGLS